MNKMLKRILITIIILIIIAIAIIVQIKKSKPSSNLGNNIIKTEEDIKNETQMAKQESLANTSEASRIKNYVGQFYTMLDTKEYEASYNLLFERFKENYFKTEDEYEEYIKSKYPKKMILNHAKLDREGKYYIATVEVIDALNTGNKFSQRVVIEEIELNKFKLSFQVI